MPCLRCGEDSGFGVYCSKCARLGKEVLAEEERAKETLPKVKLARPKKRGKVTDLFGFNAADNDLVGAAMPNVAMPNVVTPVQQPQPQQRLPPVRPTKSVPNTLPDGPVSPTQLLPDTDPDLEKARCKSVFSWAKPFNVEVARARKKWAGAKAPDNIKSPADFFDGQHDKARQDLFAMIRKIPELPPFTDQQIQEEVLKSTAAWQREASALGKNVGDQDYDCPFDKTLSTAVGFPKLTGTINPFLPLEARPLLTKNEASAASIYSDDCYAVLNDLNRAPQAYFVDSRSGRATVGRKITLTAEEAAKIGPPKYPMKLLSGAGDYIQPPGVILGFSNLPVKIPQDAELRKTKPGDPDTWPKGFAEVFKEVESAINKTKKFDQPMKITARSLVQQDVYRCRMV